MSYERKYGVYFPFVVSLFAFVVCVAIVFNVLRNGDTLTFTSFLQFLSEQGQNFNFVSFVDYSITSDWLVFNFLRDFLNIFIQIFNVAIYLSKLFIQLIVFTFNFVKFLFL